ncbi:MAG TPA: hypothetical protein VE056_02945 [Pyrinomonadaceae bacterium]|nr:hypothetical protein [Pyrinomonadaceae bacterium]
MLFVANSVVIGNGDYTDEVRNCTASSDEAPLTECGGEWRVPTGTAGVPTGTAGVHTGTAGVSPAMSAQREQLEHSTVCAYVTNAGETAGPSKAVPAKMLTRPGGSVKSQN